MQKLLAGIQECSEERSTARIFPDIIVHHRGANGAEHNLLVVEMKRNSEEDRCDFLKLCGLTDPSKPFGYQLGVYININHGRFETTWFKNGATIPQP